jgi:processive 1,2-diacylglycerol beta-glucosyltransferase
MARRVLVISVSAGSGHVRAAQAITEALAQAHPEIEVKNVDAMDYTTRFFRRLYIGTYGWMIRNARITWAWLYARTVKEKQSDLSARFSRWVERSSAGRLIRLVTEFQPEIVINVHPLPMHILGHPRNRRRSPAPLWVAITDFDLHPLWAHPQTERYFAGCDEVARLLEVQGASRERVTVTGIPIVPAFSEPAEAAERARLREWLGLAEGRPAVLVNLSGAQPELAAGAVRIAVEAASSAGGGGVITVAGRNKVLEEQVAAIRPPAGVSLKGFGFVNNMQELMAASDLTITKPGGLTSSECLARSLPMLILDPIPGQEERNAAYLVEQGVAWQAADLGSLGFKLEKLLASPEKLAAMRAAAATIARPRAAFDIADAAAAAVT